MCMLCVEIAKEKMTYREIARAYNESVEAATDHWAEIFAHIYKHSDVDKVSEALYDLRKERTHE